MDVNEYAAQKQTILRHLFAGISYVFLSFLRPGMSKSRWESLVRAIYPRVKQARDEAAFLAREFFDSNRANELQNDERLDFFVDDNYELQWLEEALRPVYNELQKDDANVDAQITDMSNRVVKVIEDGARRTLLRGVQMDEDALGWARFDPRPPTCAFCTMMISRGPKYKSAESAGFRGDNKNAEKLANDGDFDSLNELMNRWHPGCTCVVVPVYKYAGYVTEQQEDAAYEVYKRARRLAKSGKFKEILKAMRQLIRDERAEQDQTRLPTAI